VYGYPDKGDNDDEIIIITKMMMIMIIIIMLNGICIDYNLTYKIPCLIKSKIKLWLTKQHLHHSYYSNTWYAAVTFHKEY